jgi:predicted RNA-binding Zn-ribbon protein involved in translation (DUF1610 family)
MKICPSCRTLLPGNPELWRELRKPLVRNSLSRRDNKTYICNNCGLAEAMADFTGISDQDARQRLEPTLQETAQ